MISNYQPEFPEKYDPFSSRTLKGYTIRTFLFRNWQIIPETPGSHQNAAHTIECITEKNGKNVT